VRAVGGELVRARALPYPFGIAISPDEAMTISIGTSNGPRNLAIRARGHERGSFV